MRTVQLCLLKPADSKFALLQDLYKLFVQTSVSMLDELSTQQVDAVLSFVPEMAPLKINFGSICQDQTTG